MKLAFVHVLLLLLATAPSLASDEATSIPTCRSGNADGTCALYEVSLVQLIADPEKYDGKQVQVSGFIHLEFEGNGLYLHRDDFKFRIPQNGVWVDMRVGANFKGCQNSYVSIRGTFVAADHGHLGVWSGAIRDIDSCQPL